MKRDRILLVGNYGPDEQKSMQAYASMLKTGLREAGKTVVVISPTRILGRGSRCSTGVWKWIGYIDKFLIFSIFLFLVQFRYTRVHVCDHSNAMYGYILLGRKNTITCHDVIAIQAARGKIDGWQVSDSGKLFQSLIFNGLKRFNKVYCASKLTLEDLQALGHPFSAAVAENALNGKFLPPAEPWDREQLNRLKPNFPARYFLHVGSDLPRKNRVFLLEVLRLLQARNLLGGRELVCVGPNPSRQTVELAKSFGIEDKVHFIQNVRHEDLVLLYGFAEAFIFPSLNEGFGWPVAEAQACGCPVFASNREPMPEVGGEAGAYFSPLSPDDCVDRLATADLGVMRKKGLENVKRFGMDEMLSKMDFL